ncbi:hypothetical protein C8Q70DRAFT_438983 [Cubamyces menziesii]|nr:hypothetical protein C8Q70DRAFT_438983 [Cubamyces menziesii]
MPPHPRIAPLLPIILSLTHLIFDTDLTAPSLFSASRYYYNLWICLGLMALCGHSLGSSCSPPGSMVRVQYAYAVVLLAMSLLQPMVP